MKKRLIAVGLMVLFAAPFASAGILRHVVKPVVKGTAKVTAKVVVAMAKGTKAVVY